MLLEHVKSSGDPAHSGITSNNTGSHCGNDNLKIKQMNDSKMTHEKTTQGVAIKTIKNSYVNAPIPTPVLKFKALSGKPILEFYHSQDIIPKDVMVSMKISHDHTVAVQSAVEFNQTNIHKTNVRYHLI